MTTSRAAHAKDRANNGGWALYRPFWGGLLMLLSGLELFLSGNMHLALEVHFGPTGFLSYVLPLMMLLCGALSWFTPQQRLFYGILGTVVALYSLIGLNLGGFFLGTVLGLVGGGLTVAWTPDADSAPQAADPAPEGEEEEDGRLDDMLDDSGYAPERPTSGVLTDELPTTQVSPLHSYGEGFGAGSADEQLPPPHGPGELPKRRHLGPLLMAVVLTAAVVGAAHRTGEAFAAPAACPSSSPARSTAAKPAPGATTAATDPTIQPAATPTPTPSPAKTEEKPGGLLGWLNDLFTGGDKKEEEQKAEASPSPSITESPKPPASASATAKPTATRSAPCASASASPTPNNKKAEVAAGQPFVAAEPSILKADVMTMDDLTYDGVAELPRRDGTKVKVLAFSMKNSVSTPFELDTPGAGRLLLTKSSKLTVEGNVKFYTTKFSANVLGLLPLTFTPSFPPPPIPLPGFYTACTIELVYVQSNILTAPDMNIAYAA
ncbi:DUF6114 domain-containing protein [Dactylosporangium sp. CA-139066]|uniref:DUF6114 domain-containing protein n=1 Tax=Dactylosporangium sp. CA-139066 TaxID=3239930 RepID=UPI003D945A11